MNSSKENLLKEDADLLRYLISNRGLVEKAIVSGLKQCLAAHGPITKEWTGSASKRVVSTLKELLIEQRRRLRTQ